MKWLKLEDIKHHSRIEDDDEDKLLELYGSAAENGILRVMNRSWEDVRNNLSEEDINGALTIAGLLLTDHLYNHRGPTENVQVYQIPYSVDYYIKPFIRLTNDNTQEYGRNCNL